MEEGPPTLISPEVSQNKAVKTATAAEAVITIKDSIIEVAKAGTIILVW